MKLTPKIIYEEEDFLVIDKPSGLLVHAYKFFDKKSNTKIETPEPTVAGWILENFPEIEGVGENPNRPGMVHRLDRETSGTMVIAKNQKSFEYFKDLFQTRKIKKTYVALAFGHVAPAEGIIDTPFGIKNGTVKRSTRATKLVKEAVTEYETKRKITLEPNDRFPEPINLSLLEVSPKTGRTHQIRVHLSSIGHPLLGDTLYGSKKSIALGRDMGLGRLFLHAESLEFVTPTGKHLKIESDLPEELNDFLKQF